MTVEARLASKRKLISRVAHAFIRRTGFIEYDDAFQVVSLVAWRILEETDARQEVDGLIAWVGFRRLTDEMRSGRVTGVNRYAAAGGAQVPVSLNTPVPGGEDIDRLDSLADTRDPYAAVDNSIAIAGALRALTPRHRAIVALHYYEGLSRIEIAELLGVSPSRVGQLLTIAHRRMRPLLAA